MKNSSLAMVELGILLMFGLGLQTQAEEKGAEKKEGAPAAEAVTYGGTFNWNREKGKTHPLKGVFTPVGENKWNVIWSFKWKKKPVTYKGVVEGNLVNGNITGKSSTKDGKRNWTFTGTAKDGVMTCNHKELKGRKETPTGTIIIKKL